MIRWDALEEKLEEMRAPARDIILATHVNADGDGLGCELALRSFLASRGHTVRIINNDPVPKKLSFLPGVERIVVHDPERSGRLVREAGLVIVLDNSSPQRLGRLLPDLEAGEAFTVCIDHHAEENPYWNLNCVDPEASASGQLVYDLIRVMGGEITPDIAIALYVSFVTDTGHFRFSKTTPEVHRIIAKLLEKGSISPPRVYRALFEDVPAGVNRMIAHALADTHYEHANRFAWGRLTRRQLEECRGFDEDTGDLVNMLLAVKGVEAAALFKELPDGQTKVSLRSLGDVDVNRVASKFGGGGHRNASGVMMSQSLDESVASIVDAVSEVLPPR